MESKINKLDDIEKKNPFKVPENYFAQFNAEIMNKLPEKESVKPKTVSMWNRVKPWVYVAAACIGLYFVIWTANNNSFIKEEITANRNSLEIATNHNYWANAAISEDEFYQYVEDSLIEEGYYDYLCDEVATSANNM